MKEGRDELDLPPAQQLLTRATLARLAYLGPDNAEHTATVLLDGIAEPNGPSVARDAGAS